jgi:hypothetical protein
MRCQALDSHVPLEENLYTNPLLTFIYETLGVFMHTEFLSCMSLSSERGSTVLHCEKFDCSFFGFIHHAIPTSVYPFVVNGFRRCHYRTCHSYRIDRDKVCDEEEILWKHSRCFHFK